MQFVLDPESLEFRPLLAGRLQEQTGHVLDGSLIGWGCFETLYWNGTRFEGLSEHMDLLALSVKTLGMPLKLDFATLAQAMTRLLRAHQTDQSPARVRVSLCGAAIEAQMDQKHKARLGCVLSVLACPDGRSDTPLSLVTTRIRRNESSPLSQIKSINYGDNLLARQEAVEQGGDEALMLNMRGHIACLSMGNMLTIKDKGDTPCVYTPPPEEGTRPGYMRAVAMQAAQSLGWDVIQTALIPGALFRMRAVTACNSLWGVRAVTTLDGMSLPDDPDLVMHFRKACLAIC